VISSRLERIKISQKKYWFFVLNGFIEMHNFLVCILGFKGYKLNSLSMTTKLYNSGLILIDATVVQNSVAAASTASSLVPVVNLPRLPR
jgi:hypothetical protein